jgi:hypothetical protein
MFRRYKQTSKNLSFDALRLCKSDCDSALLVEKDMS